MAEAADRYKNKIITIPNILSFFRLCLIPVIVWLYLGKQDYTMAGFMVIFSGLTDVVDGFIARRFNMISDFGKVLDPIADKSTQAVVIILLATRFPLMLLPIALGIVKETFMAISGYMVVKKCNVVLSAEWHGKLATVILTIVMAMHLIWPELNPTLSSVSIVISAIFVLLALILYAVRNIKYLTRK